MQRVNVLNSLFFFLLFLLSSCVGNSTEELLQGKLINFEEQLPQIFHPQKGHLQIISKEAILKIRWEKLPYDRYYEITIAQDENFQQILDGFPQKTTETFFLFSIPDSRTYYIRLSSENSREGQFQTTYFHATDAIYVACDNTCDNAAHIGNKNDPYENIGAAMAKANSLGLEVRVASSLVPYNEILFLQGGTSVRGGYTLPEWVQNLNQKSKITANYAPVMSCLAQKPFVTTVIEGFQVETTAVGQDLATVYFEDCENFIFRANHVQSPLNATNNSTGLYALNSKIKIEKNFIGGQNSNSGGQVRALWLLNNQSEVVGNQLLGTRNDGHGYAVFEMYGENKFTNNLILGGFNNFNYSTLFGVYSSNTTSKFIHNTIGGGRALNTNTRTYAFFVWADFPVVLENNLLFTTQGSNRYCFAEGNANLTEAELRNNNFFDCPQGIYVGQETPSDCESGSRHCYEYICNDGRPGDSMGCTNGGDVLPNGEFTGNVKLGSAASLFVSVNGADNNLITMNDNNWALQPAVLSLCNVVFGGKTPVVEVSFDFAGLQRSAVLPTSGVCAGNITNSNAAGVSMGAYEQDN